MFRIIDKVLLLKEPTHKLSDQYTGPYEITKGLGNNNVKLKIGIKGTKVVHVDKFKSCLPNPEVRGTLQHQSSEDTTDIKAVDTED